MDVPIFLDVSDLPASLKRWNSEISCDDGLLDTECYGKLPGFKVPEDFFILANDDETCSGISLESAHSEVSTALNASVDLNLCLDVDLFEDTMAQTLERDKFSLASPALSTSACGGLALQLNLDTSVVVAAWRSANGDCPVFSVPREDVMLMASEIPSAAACADSLSPKLQINWAVGAFATSGMKTGASRSNLSSKVHLSISKPSGGSVGPGIENGVRPARKSISNSRKRRIGNKVTDKRPRIKGRFVTREELKAYLNEQSHQNSSESDGETAVVHHCPC